MRVEANVSIRPRGTDVLGTRVEVKNMNSFRSVERAIAYEIERQTRGLESGESLVQETRGWDDNRGETYTMRLKEESQDYRYFPEPDLPPLRTDPAWLASIRAAVAGAAGSQACALRHRLRAVRLRRIGDRRRWLASYFDAAMNSRPSPDPQAWRRVCFARSLCASEATSRTCSTFSATGPSWRSVVAHAQRPARSRARTLKRFTPSTCAAAEPSRTSSASAA